VLLLVESSGVVLEELNQGSWLRAFIKNLGLAFIDAPAAVHGLIRLVIERNLARDICAYTYRSLGSFGFDQVGTVWPQILYCGAELTRSEAKAQSYVLCEFPGNVMLLANPCRYYVDLRSGGGY
jgi:hypothetical protein